LQGGRQAENVILIRSQKNFENVVEKIELNHDGVRREWDISVIISNVTKSTCYLILSYPIYVPYYFILTQQ